MYFSCNVCEASTSAQLSCFLPFVLFVLNTRLVSWVSLRCFPHLFAVEDGKHWVVLISAFLLTHSTMELGNGSRVCMVGMAMGKVMVTRSLLLLLGVASGHRQPSVGEKRLKGLIIFQTPLCSFLKTKHRTVYGGKMGGYGRKV